MRAIESAINSVLLANETMQFVPRTLKATPDEIGNPLENISPTFHRGERGSQLGVIPLIAQYGFTKVSTEAVLKLGMLLSIDEPLQNHLSLFSESPQYIASQLRHRVLSLKSPRMLSLGAGRGLTESLLMRTGISVIAVDKQSPGATYLPILAREVSGELISHFRERDLLLCSPDLEPGLVAGWVRNYAKFGLGKVVHIGNGADPQEPFRCDQQMLDECEAHFQKAISFKLPDWPTIGSSNTMTVYIR